MRKIFAVFFLITGTGVCQTNNSGTNAVLNPNPGGTVVAGAAVATPPPGEGRLNPEEGIKVIIADLKDPETGGRARSRLADNLVKFVWSTDRDHSDKLLYIWYIHKGFNGRETEEEVGDNDARGIALPNKGGNGDDSNENLLTGLQQSDHDAIKQWIGQSDEDLSRAAALDYALVGLVHDGGDLSRVQTWTDKLHNKMSSWTDQLVPTVIPPDHPAPGQQAIYEQRPKSGATPRQLDIVKTYDSSAWKPWDHDAFKLAERDDPVHSQKWLYSFLDGAAGQVPAILGLPSAHPNNVISSSIPTLPGLTPQTAPAVSAVPTNSAPPVPSPTLPPAPKKVYGEADMLGTIPRFDKSGRVINRGSSNMIFRYKDAQGNPIYLSVRMISEQDNTGGPSVRNAIVIVNMNTHEYKEFSLNNFSKQGFKFTGDGKEQNYKFQLDRDTGKITITDAKDKSALGVGQNIDPLTGRGLPGYAVQSADLTINKLDQGRRELAQTLNHPVYIKGTGKLEDYFKGKLFYEVPQVGKNAGFAYLIINPDGTAGDVGLIYNVVQVGATGDNEVILKNGKRRFDAGWINGMHCDVEIDKDGNLVAEEYEASTDKSNDSAKKEGEHAATENPASPSTPPPDTTKKDLLASLTVKPVAVEHVPGHDKWDMAYYTQISGESEVSPENEFYLVFHDKGDSAIRVPGVLVCDGQKCIEDTGSVYRIRTASLGKDQGLGDLVEWLDLSRMDPDKGLPSAGPKDTGHFYKPVAMSFFNIPKSEIDDPANLPPFDPKRNLDIPMLNKIAFVEQIEAWSKPDDGKEGYVPGDDNHRETGKYQVNVGYSNWDVKLKEFFRDYGSKGSNSFFGKGEDSELNDSSPKEKQEKANRKTVTDYITKERADDEAAKNQGLYDSKKWEPSVLFYMTWKDNMDVPVAEFISHGDDHHAGRNVTRKVYSTSNQNPDLGIPLEIKTQSQP